jgi:hypothetical protein
MSADNILRVWDDATPEQLARGREWYAEAYRTAQTFSVYYGVSIETAAGVLAATSPNNSWRANVKLAERILSTGDTSRGYFKTGLAKARRILDGENPETVFASKVYFKVANFYRAILSRGTNGVCVDRHAWDIYTGVRHTEDKSTGLPVRPQVAGKRYAEAMEAYNLAAAILSEREGRPVSGCEVQAVTWIVWRRRYWSEGAFDVEETMPISVQFEDVIGTDEFASMIHEYLMEGVAA